MSEEYHEGVAEGIHGIVHWNYGRDSQLAFARMLSGRERHVLYVELDGKRYVPAKPRDLQADLRDDGGKMPDWAQE